MKKIELEKYNYNRSNDLKKLLNSLDEAVTKYNNDTKNADSSLNEIENSITSKTKRIDKLNIIAVDLSKKNEEFEEIKSASKSIINELKTKKKELAFSDSEVQKMEIEDIDSLIEAKRAKIEKIDEKITNTKEKIKTNQDSLNKEQKDLEELEKKRIEAKESLEKTNAIIDLTNKAIEDYINKVENILENKQNQEEETINETIENQEEDINSLIDNSKEEIEDDVSLDTNIENNDETNISIEDMWSNSIIPPITSEDLNEEIPTNNEENQDTNKEEINQEDDLNSLNQNIFDSNLDNLNLNEEIANETNDDDTNKLVEIFNKENIDFNDFSEYDKSQMEKKSSRVEKNLEILKKHNIPLSYTMHQAGIYYNISHEDLEDLLNIITYDENGNGMGFSIDFTYNILTELSNTDVDKLIEVYNSEFMNINSKSGIIKLLKNTNPNIGTFAENRKANEDLLKEYGINNIDNISNNYSDFINLDNPLFKNVINMFDKDDLVEKLNNDISIIPQIMDYWKNN